MTVRGWKICHVTASALCVALGLRFSAILAGTEFSGGSVTGPLLTLHDVALLCFLLSAVMIVAYRRAALLTVVLGFLFAVPLYAYFIVRRVFRGVFPGEYHSGAVPQYFVADGGALAGVAASCAVVWTALSSRRASM